MKGQLTDDQRAALATGCAAAARARGPDPAPPARPGRACRCPTARSSCGSSTGSRPACRPTTSRTRCGCPARWTTPRWTGRWPAWWPGTRRCAPGWSPGPAAARSRSSTRRRRRSPERVDLSAWRPARGRRRCASSSTPRRSRPFDLAAGPAAAHLAARGCAAGRARAADRGPPHRVRRLVGRRAGARPGRAVRGRGRPASRPALPELPVQFADYALWERDRLRGPALAELEDYWREALDGVRDRSSSPPTGRARCWTAFDGARRPAPWPTATLLDGLRELSRREGTTLFVTLMAGLQALLHRYTGQTDLVVGTASANRGRAELAPLIGFLVNTLPIRGDLSGDPPFTELLARLKDADHRRLRPPGPAVRQAGRDAEGGAGPEPGAAVPDRAVLRRARPSPGAPRPGVELSAHRPDRRASTRPSST